MVNYMQKRVDFDRRANNPAEPERLLRATGGEIELKGGSEGLAQRERERFTGDRERKEMITKC
jgi:hypothetical protein